MKVPPGFGAINEEGVASKLKKTLYGLKQSS